MTIEIKVPVLPESVADATIAKWHKKAGEFIARDETLVDIETDKVVLEVPAPTDGVLTEILCKDGTTVAAQQLIGRFEEKSSATSNIESTVKEVNGSIMKKTTEPSVATAETTSGNLSPAVRRLVAELDVNVAQVKGSGKGGRVVKEDITKHVQQQNQQTLTTPQPEIKTTDNRHEERVPMTRLRQRVAERLLNAQQQMAILTTFNEVDMQAIMNLRNEYKDIFEKTHEIRLGFMSFFVKAAVTALKRFPNVNAFIEGNEIIYHNYFDVGVAVSTERGLVVPILRNAETMSMAEIEIKVAEFAQKARNNKLALEEMTGGTFSITNGGVFGSLLSTPILNPPQSAILGMHKIEQRPVVINNQIVIRPMMYLALSYDHRIIDGKDSVGFLKTIKELLEEPARLLLDV